jgi:hypothetical protein
MHPFSRRQRGLTDDERNHASAVSARSLEPFDELLDLPYLDLVGVAVSAGGGLAGRHSLGWVGKRAVGSGWQRNLRSSRPRWRWGHSF